MRENRKTHLFFPFYCYGTQWAWEKSWDEEYRGEYPVGVEIEVKSINCSKQKEIEQQEYTCPFWLPLSIRKRKQGNRKKQGKAKGVTNQYFIQTAPWIKILCIDRSNVQFTYSCSLEKKTNIFADWRICPSQLFLKYLLYTVAISRVCFTGYIGISAEPDDLIHQESHIHSLKL